MWLLVGLGNPGRGYANNRHNLGYMVLDELSRRVGAPAARLRLGAEISEATLGDERVVLCKPVEYMNVSGQPLSRVAGFWKIPLERIVVIHDDMDLEFGRIRIMKACGTGGHNGLRSIVAELGSKEFIRVRIGIGRPPAAWDPADYVLADFSTDEQRTMKNLIEEAAQAVEVLVKTGLVAAMNRFNQRKKTEGGA
jgi:PTH1 family peptidyl-tRNA hydrolase